MGVFRFLRGILRLSVLFAVVIVQQNKVVEFVFAAENDPQIWVNPLWDDTNNDTESCILEDLRPQERKHVIHGSPYVSCSMHVTTLLADYAYAVLEVPSNDGLNGAFLLHYERLGELTPCTSKYVKIEGQAESCTTLVLQDVLRLELQGNVSLVINEVSELDFTSKEQRTCPESYNKIPAHQDPKFCRNVKAYDRGIQCAHNFNPAICQISFHQEYCNHTLSLHEVTALCPRFDKIQILKSFLLIPLTTIDLDLRHNNIITLRGSLFYDLKYLDVLWLSSNYLTFVSAGTFSGLDNLFALDLSNNILSRLDADAFEGLENRLQILALFGNQLATLHADLFRDLRSLRRLELDDNYLTHLPGNLFRNLRNLEEVYLYGNGMGELQPNMFNGTNNILKIALNNNNLTTIPPRLFSETNHLKLLYLHANHLVALDESIFFGLVDLIGLYLSNNKLTHLPVNIFRDNVNLLEVLLNDNALLFLNGSYFEGMADLMLLELRENQLHHLSSESFSGMIGLQSLYLMRNNLSELNANLFKDLKSLWLLHINWNELTALDDNVFRGLSNLNQLYLNNNKLRYLSAAVFQDLENLVELLMSNNQLVMLDDGVFQNLFSLLQLDLSDNYLTVIPDSLFSNTTNLYHLWLVSNEIAVVNVGAFSGLDQLFNLHLGNNQIKELHVDVFRGLFSLYELNLRDNLLSALPEGLFRDMVSLVRLSLLKNRLVSFEPDTFRGLMLLSKLAVNENKLKELPDYLFAGLPSLDNLWMYRNNLTALPAGLFNGSTNLNSLVLNHNSLSQLPEDIFYNLTKLWLLDLANNKLLSLGKEIFQSLYELRYLILFNNDLKMIDGEMFQSVGNLRYLELSNNELDDVPALAKLTLLTYANLKDNPLLDVQPFSISGMHNFQLVVTPHEVCKCFVTALSNTSKCMAAKEWSVYLTCQRLLPDRVLMCMMWIIGLGALCGNAFVMGWRQFSKVKNKVQGLLLSNLALSDFLMGVYMVMVASADVYYGDSFPMYSESWRLGITCRVAGALSIMSSEASVFFVMLISIDRFISIRFPYSTRRLGVKLTIVLSVVTWMVALTLGIVPSVLSGMNFKFYDNSHVCIGLPLETTDLYKVYGEETYITGESIYTYVPYEFFETTYKSNINGLFFSSAVFYGVNILVYAIIVACYLEIVRAVKASSEQVGRSRDMREQITLTVKVSAIVLTDFLCWCPIIILGILLQTRVVSDLPPSVSAWLVTVALPINSAINPFLYTVTDIIANYKKKQADKKFAQADKKYGKSSTRKAKTSSGSTKTVETVSQKISSTE